MKLLTRVHHLANRATSLALFFARGGVAYARHVGVTVGSGCRIYTTAFGSEPFLISIGDHVTVTSGVRILTHDGASWLARDEKGRRFLYRPVKIGSHVFIGINAIIMPGVVIEDRCIIAPGSVVTKSVPAGSVVAGIPAKIIGSYEDYESKVLDSYVSEHDRDANLDYQTEVMRLVDNRPAPRMRRDA